MRCATNPEGGHLGSGRALVTPTSGPIPVVHKVDPKMWLAMTGRPGAKTQNKEGEDGGGYQNPRGADSDCQPSRRLTLPSVYLAAVTKETRLQGCNGAVTTNALAGAVENHRDRLFAIA